MSGWLHGSALSSSPGEVAVNRQETVSGAYPIFPGNKQLSNPDSEEEDMVDGMLWLMRVRLLIDAELGASCAGAGALMPPPFTVVHGPP